MCQAGSDRPVAVLCKVCGGEARASGKRNGIGGAERPDGWICPQTKPRAGRAFNAGQIEALDAAEAVGPARASRCAQSLAIGNFIYGEPLPIGRVIMTRGTG